MKEQTVRSSISYSEVSRLYALALAIVESRPQAESVLARVISELPLQTQADQRLIATLEHAIAERKTRGHTMPPTTPPQVPASDARGEYTEQMLTQRQWKSLWSALTGGASDPGIDDALAALDAFQNSLPITDEDIP